MEERESVGSINRAGWRKKRSKVKKKKKKKKKRSMKNRFGQGINSVEQLDLGGCSLDGRKTRTMEEEEEEELREKGGLLGCGRTNRRGSEGSVRPKRAKGTNRLGQRVPRVCRHNQNHQY